MADELFDFSFMVIEERVHVVLVEQTGTLCLGEDEVRQEKETEPAIERQPGTKVP